MIGMAFDNETTGLVYNATLPLAKQPEVTEFYGCLFDDKNGKIIEEIDVLVKPGNKISDKIIEITGITNEMVEKEKPIGHYFPDIMKMIGKAKFITAHNLAYDMEMLGFEARRNNIEINCWPTRRYCTVEQTVHLRGIRLNLSALHEYLFGEAFAGAHRAKVDVQAQVRCFLELKKRGEL